MHNAYMIRSDGKLIPVTIHLYGNPDSVEETVYAAEWLYSHTQYQSTRDLIVELVAAYAVSIDNAKGNTPSLPVTIDNLLDHIVSLPYKVLTPSFIVSLADQISRIDSIRDLDILNKLVCGELNQEFLRARYGGMYDSGQNSTMYFRVSSIGFNWFPIIWEFVYTNRGQIQYVTVVRDKESTGSSTPYRLSGEPISNMPANEFITARGNPVIDAKPKHSTLYMRYPHMNSTRAYERYIRDMHKENFSLE